MDRLYILLTVTVVMLAAPLFGAHEALAAIFPGTAGNDIYQGTEEVDYLKGRAGDDYLDAAGGNDTIEGGRGDDRIIPGEGADVVYAGAGNDRIIRARHCKRGLHRLRGRLRPGRDHTPRRPD